MCRASGGRVGVAADAAGQVKSAPAGARVPRQPPAWVGPYVGLPYRNKGRGEFVSGRPGFDCWGLLVHVLRAEFGIELPDYLDLYDDAAATAANGRALAAALPRYALCAVPRAGARVGDVVLLKVKGWPAHVGLIVARETMLHIEKGTDSVIERLDSLRWRGNVVGIFRPGLYAAQASTAAQ